MRLFRFFLLSLVFGDRGQAADPVEFTVGSFVFARPESWGWVVPSFAHAQGAAVGARLWTEVPRPR